MFSQQDDSLKQRDKASGSNRYAIGYRPYSKETFATNKLNHERCTTMLKHTAVVLDSVAQADQVARYLSDIVQPGIKIEFLIHTKPRRMSWFLASISGMFIDNSRAVDICEQEWRFNLAREKHFAERKLATLREALVNQGCASELLLYTGSTNRALAQVGKRQPGAIIVLRPRRISLLETRFRNILRKVGLNIATDVSKASLAFASLTSET